eukprot:TRINITY_DN78580_c0_g1_i1.p1 TRINITY_DN78580_c0_g1~~TRINITY_DN78580_c0_g1_i1.p1  ORF type:complete len:201 (+),score=38.09 TRINITY_DN78580_c0_g1_i1:51-653(+)
MGAAASLGGNTTIKGSKICDDPNLQDKLLSWEEAGVTFTGVMLQAEQKETTTVYNIERDQWTATDVISGDTAILLKTAANGWLQMRLLPPKQGGLFVERGDSYRVSSSGSQGSKKSGKRSNENLKVVDSSTVGFEVADVRNALNEQRDWVWGSGPNANLPFEDFGKKMFEMLAGRRCEGDRDGNPLKGGGGKGGSKGKGS